MRKNAESFAGRSGRRPCFVAALALAACSETLGPLQGGAEQGRRSRSRESGRQRRQHRVADRCHPAQPERSRSPTTRAAPPTPRLATTRARSRISRKRSRSIRTSSPPIPIARSPTARSVKDGPALADFNPAIAANPNDAPAYLGRANLLRSQGHLTEALADLDAGDPPQSRRRAGLSRARADLSAPGQQRNRRSPTSTTRSIAIRSPARRTRRAARACSRPANTIWRSRTSTPRSTSIRTTPKPGRVWGSPTRSSGNQAKAVEFVPARARWSRRAIRQRRPGCSGWARPERCRAREFPICRVEERRRDGDCGDAPFVQCAIALTMVSVIFLASPNSIIVLSRKNSSFSTPA